MKFSKAIEGLLLHKSVQGLSPRSLETYQYKLNRLAKFLDDPEVSSITPTDLRRFLHYLRHEYTPKRINGDQSPLTGTSLRHYWVACRSFYTWAVGELGIEDALAPIPAPKAKSTQPNPLTKDEVKSLVQSARTQREHCILLMLLDTGLRASELCALKVGDVDPKTGKVFVIGKGNKERYCYLGRVARRWLWKYFAGRDAEPDESTLCESGRATGSQMVAAQHSDQHRKTGGGAQSIPPPIPPHLRRSVLEERRRCFHPTDITGPLVLEDGATLRRRG